MEMGITAEKAISWGYKRHGKTKCSSCGAVAEQFIKEVDRGDLKDGPLQATCICGLPLMRWHPMSRVDYMFVWPDPKEPTSNPD